MSAEPQCPYRDSLLFHMPFHDGPSARFAVGDSHGEFTSLNFPYDHYLEPGVRRRGLLLRSHNVLAFKTAGNLNREAGTIALWVRPLFDWSCASGGIVFDARYEEGSVVPNDPSPRVSGAAHEFAPGTPFHVAMTWDSQYGACYVNGCMEGRVRLNDGPFRRLPDTFVIGNPVGGIHAVIGDFRIYDQPLDAKALAELARGPS